MAKFFKQKPVEVPQNAALINAITPVSIDFERSQMAVGEYYAKAYGVIKYPPTVEQGWLSDICNAPGTITAINFRPASNAGELTESISKNVQMHESIAKTTGNPAEQEAALKGAEDGRTLIRQITQEGETIGHVSIAAMAMAPDAKSLAAQANRLTNRFDLRRCKARCLSTLQRESLQSLSPYYVKMAQLSPILERITPLSSILGGFPFAASGYTDTDGYYFAKDARGGLILLNLWKRQGDRNNGNIVVVGQPGTGKSTSIKHLIMSEYALGTRILILDPEGEYKELTQEFNGDWINAAGGAKKGLLNPLQVRPQPAEDDTGEEGPNLMLHLKMLETFFALYLPDLSDILIALLNESLEETYAAKGITWNTNIERMRPDQFPIIGDLYDLLVKKRDEKEKVRRENDPNHYETLVALLRNAAEGADQFLWNGHTSIAPKQQIVCIDTHGLQNMPDNIKRAQYFNYMSWAWEEMSRDRNERVLLIADEAWIMVDPKVPQTMAFLRNISKRARKYEAALAVIFQSVVDVLDSSVKLYGQALMDNASIKILMGMDGQNLKDCAELFNLNELEQDVLLARQKGRALAMFGARRLPIKFDLPSWELEMMGRGGGR